MTLSLLGLSDTEVQAYQALAAVPSATADELARRLQLDTGPATDVLDALVARDFAVRRTAGHFAAVQPAVALGGLLADRHGDLRAAEATTALLESTFQEARRGQVPDAFLDIVHGPREVAARLRQLQLHARHEVLSLVKSPVAVLGSTDNDAEDVAVDRGVTYRVVLERAMLREEPRLAAEIHRAQAAGEQVRVAASVPTKLFIFDREIALVPLGIGNAPVESAFLLGAGGLLDALVALFDLVWAGGQDIDLGASDAVPAEGPAGEDRVLLTLLLAGMTDEAIARELDISTRTVQRRVRALLDGAGVDTRLQLGYAAAKHHWVTGTESSRGKV